jgi:hypothetical protein
MMVARDSIVVKYRVQQLCRCPHEKRILNMINSFLDATYRNSKYGGENTESRSDMDGRESWIGMLRFLI